MTVPVIDSESKRIRELTDPATVPVARPLWVNDEPDFFTRRRLTLSLTRCVPADAPGAATPAATSATAEALTAAPR